MSETKTIDPAAAMDAFDEVKDAQVLIEAIQNMIEETRCDHDLDRLSYLLSIYKEKMSYSLPRLEAIIDCQN